MTPEQQIIKLLQGNILMRVQKAYGLDITADFKMFIERIQGLYRNIDISQFSSVVAIMGHKESGIGIKMKQENIGRYNQKDLIVNFLDDEGYVEVVMRQKVDIETLSKDSLVYQWTQDAEISDQFMIKGALVPYGQEQCPNGLSYFAQKTYKDLEEALIYYRDNIALNAKQKNLQEALCHNRLFFKNAPESLLQEALCEFLMSTLRDRATVKREENVDISHPVDLRITFKSTNHMALIEIKWLGRSLNAGHTGVSANYDSPRANAGAKQLVDYIDKNIESFSGSITSGYLVVYDLRRRNNNNIDNDKLSHADADYYQLEDLRMNPDYKTIRTDYKGTYRFYIKVDSHAYSD